jgi:hypothetical protein
MCRWENDNIIKVLRETGCEDVGWIRVSGYGPVASSCEHNNETSGSMTGGEFLE